MVTVQDFVDAKLYPDEEAVIQDALRHLLLANPEMKIQLAVHRYQKEGLSLAKAAKFAGMSLAQMKNVLVERGIPLRFDMEKFKNP